MCISTYSSDKITLKWNNLFLGKQQTTILSFRGLLLFTLFNFLLFIAWNIFFFFLIDCLCCCIGIFPWKPLRFFISQLGLLMGHWASSCGKPFPGDFWKQCYSTSTTTAFFLMPTLMTKDEEKNDWKYQEVTVICITHLHWLTF